MKFNKITSFVVVSLVLAVGGMAYLQLDGSQQPDDESGNLAEYDNDSASSANSSSSSDSPSSNSATNTRKAPDNKSLVKKYSDESIDKDDEFQFIFSPEAPSLWPLAMPEKQIEIDRRNQIQAWLIDIKRELISSLTLGEKLNLYIPQTKRQLTITLKSVKQGRYSESRIASIDGSVETYSAYFTLGETSLYGTIETPEGIFHVEKRNADDGIIYAASEIRKNLDYSINDAVSVTNPEKIL
jgi:hypothetical protein